MQNIDLEVEFETLEDVNETAFHAVELASKIPLSLYENLPPTLKDLCDNFEKPNQKAVFLSAALPVLASLMPNVWAMHYDGAYSPDLYMAVVAPPSSGKQAAKTARVLASVTNDRLLEQSKTDIAKYAASQAEAKADKVPFDEPEPVEKALIIPANASAAAFLDALNFNGGRGLAFEEEIDTISNTMAQEWGDYSPILRNSFHHEPVSALRKGGKRIDVKNPKLSMFLSGTPAQYLRIIPSAENGLYSRICVYFFTDQNGWLDQRPTNRTSEREEKAEAYAERLDWMFGELMRRKDENGKARKLWVKLTDNQWDAHAETFAGVLQSVRSEYNNAIIESVVKRSGIITLRIATILTICRCLDAGKSMFSLHSAECEDVDFQTAITLAQVYADHALRMSQYLPKRDTNLDRVGREIQEFLKALPKEFKGSDAEKVGASKGISKMTVYRWLNKLKDENFLTSDKGRKATYKKVT